MRLHPNAVIAGATGNPIPTPTTVQHDKSERLRCQQILSLMLIFGRISSLPPVSLNFLLLCNRQIFKRKARGPDFVLLCLKITVRRDGFVQCVADIPVCRFFVLRPLPFVLWLRLCRTKLFWILTSEFWIPF
jgi:hypothetical protein